MSSTLNGRLITELTLSYPASGCYRADVVLAEGAPPEGKVTLTLGGLEIVGWVLRSGSDVENVPHATVVGGIGWNAEVKAPIAFQSDAGVNLRNVLTALSKAAGETLQPPEGASIGSHYELAASTPNKPVRYSDALNDLVRLGAIPTWRVDVDGVTRFAPRTSSAVTDRATLIRKDAGLGLYVYGLDDPKTFLPGNTIEGLIINRIVLRQGKQGFQADVYTEPKTSAPTLREMIQRIAQDRAAPVLATYVVASVATDGRLNLVPPPDAQHLPPIANVEQWSLGGTFSRPKAGAEVLVLFRDTKGTRPVVIAFDTQTPDSVTIGNESDALYAACRGDLTQAGGPGTMCTLMPLTGAGLPPNNAIGAGIPCLISFDATPPTPGTAAPLYGTIMSGTQLLRAAR